MRVTRDTERTESAATTDRLARREFLRRGGLALGGGLLAPAATSEQARVRQRLVVPRTERLNTLGPDYTGRGLLLTDPLREENPPLGLDGCRFESWNPDGYDAYEGLYVDLGRGAIAETKAYAAADEPTVDPGTAFVIDEQVDCGDRFVGVLVERIPGFRVE